MIDAFIIYIFPMKSELATTMTPGLLMIKLSSTVKSLVLSTEIYP